MRLSLSLRRNYGVVMMLHEHVYENITFVSFSFFSLSLSLSPHTHTHTHGKGIGQPNSNNKSIFVHFVLMFLENVLYRSYVEGEH